MILGDVVVQGQELDLILEDTFQLSIFYDSVMLVGIQYVR